MSVLRSVEVMVLDVCVEEGSILTSYSVRLLGPLVSSFMCLLLKQKNLLYSFLLEHYL